jgi:predicted nucleic acid-binding protein
MTKAVIDTNVLVSGLLNEHGAEAAVLLPWLRIN